MEKYDDDLFFEHKYPTIDIERGVDHIESFEAFEKYFSDDLMSENLLLGNYLSQLLERYHTNAYNISLEIGRSRSYVGKIANGRELNPSRDVLLAICVRIGATVGETQTLLKYSGKQPLYARRKRDAIIWYALKKKQSLVKLDIYLDEKGYKPLCKIIERKK